MGTAKLNIWVSEVGDPCKISNKTWYINIYRCDGHILEWCDKRYIILPAKCGHLEVEVPPGVYVINAVWGYWVDPHDVIHGNHFTHNAIVHAVCEKTVCVTLFTPHAHICGVIYMLAGMDLAKQEQIPKELAENIRKIVERVNRIVPAPPKPFELEVVNEIAKREAAKG